MSKTRNKHQLLASIALQLDLPEANFSTPTRQELIAGCVNSLMCMGDEQLTLMHEVSADFLAKGKKADASDIRDILDATDDFKEYGVASLRSV